MKLPRVRFTVRRLMVAVAVTGFILGGEAIRRRWLSYRASVENHANEERRMRLLLREGFLHETAGDGTRRRWQIGPGGERERIRERLLYHSLMKDRYQRAARYPWLPVAPDPQ